VRREHFDRLQPVCPTCRARGRAGAPLAVGEVVREEGGDIREGMLVCTARECLREHPIIDGIPIVVADIRGYVAHQLGDIRARSDLSPFLDSALGDCAGPGSELDRTRYQLSSFVRGHYGDLDRDEPGGREGSLVALFEQAMELLSAPAGGLWLDLGCAVGRSTFELAARTGDLAIGVDLNFSALQVAERLARTGRLEFPQRRVGLVYDRRALAVDLPARDRVGFWAGDVTLLPFVADRFDGALSLNLVDCVGSPLDHLAEMGRVVRPGREVALATPYDWASTVTPVEAWIGGHSQRAEGHGSSVLEMRRILSDAAPASVPIPLRVVRERDRWPWHVYVHERATMVYHDHILVARVVDPAGG
jgi:SAM-dependent methyltransferase/uncharacterized protein YbaR (Trm112 family)